MDRSASRTDASTSSDRLIGKTVWIMVIALLLTYLVHSFGKAFDEDEFQCMALAVNMSEGKQLYVDLWDNHGPLLSYLAAGIYHFAGWQSHSVIFLLRGLMLLCLAGNLVVFHRLARAVSPSPSYFPQLACFFLLLSELFALVAVEVRPDNLLNLFFASSLLLWFRSRDTGKASGFFWSGLLLGCAFLCSFKTLLLGGAAGAMFFTAMALRRRIDAVPVLAFGAGTAVAPVIMIAALEAQGLLEPFWQNYVLQNSDRVHESFFIAFFIVVYWAPIGGGLLLSSLFYAARKTYQGLVPEKILLLTVCSWVLLLEYCFILPTHHEQSTLPFLTTGTIVQTWVVLQLLPRFRLQRFSVIGKLWPHRPNVPALVILTLVVTAVSHQWFLVKSAEKIEWADGLMERIEPGAYVFDGIGLPLFRPHPTRYLSWVNTLRSRVRNNSLGIDLPAVLDGKDVRYVIQDFRVRSMGTSVDEFLTKNYLPLNYKDLWAAGKIVSGEAGRHREVEIEIAGAYFWEIESGSEQLWVDGAPATNPIQLGDGMHRVNWEGDGALILSIAPPDRN